MTISQKRIGSLNTGAYEDRLDDHDSRLTTTETVISILDYDIVVGSSGEVSAGIADNVITDLDDTLVVAGSKVLFLNGTHALTGNLTLSNADISIAGESTQAIWDLAGFNLTFSGDRADVDMRFSNVLYEAINISGQNSKFFGRDVPFNYIVIADSTNSVETVGNSRGNNAFRVNGWIITPPIVNITGKQAVVGSVDETMREIQVSPDGTKLIGHGQQNNNIYQFSFGIPWDIETLTYDSVFYDSSVHSTSPFALFVKPDGTALYQSFNGNGVWQFTMSTPWDLSTISSDSIHYEGGATSYSGLCFSRDGTNMYLGGADVQEQHTLSVAWDLSTAGFDSITISTGTRPSTQAATAISADGKKFFVLGFQTSDRGVFQYDLSTPFDLSTATDSSIDIDLTAEIGVGGGLAFSHDGSYLYISDPGADKKIFQIETGNFSN